MLKWLMGLFCKHTEQRFIRNIYGDEINHCNGSRSVWQCKKCGTIVFGNSLNKNENI